MRMIACEVIIPFVSGRTRLPWKSNKIQYWEDATAYLFGGIRPISLGVTGKWCDTEAPLDVGIIPDPQNSYEIAVEMGRIEELREFIKFTCAHFEQKCTYFKVGHDVEFIEHPLGWP